MLYLLRYLKNLLWPKPISFPINSWRTFDFTRPERDHWAGYEYGDNYSAHFSVRSRWPVKVGDQMLIRLRSGSIGRYHIYSSKKDFTGMADYKVQATAIRYEKRIIKRTAPLVRPIPLLPAPRIKALLTDGSGSVRPSNSELLDLSGSFADSTGVFWSLLARNEARRGWANSMRTAGDCKIR